MSLNKNVPKPSQGTEMAEVEALSSLHLAVLIIAPGLQMLYYHVRRHLHIPYQRVPGRAQYAQIHIIWAHTHCKFVALLKLCLIDENTCKTQALSITIL